MGLLKIITRLLKGPSTASKKHCTSGYNTTTYSRSNDDVIQGMMFHPTLKLSTPLWILEKSGEVYLGNGTPPDHGGQEFGCWVPKLSPEFDFLDKGATAASDAGSVDKEHYLEYAIGLLSIFESKGSINEKMALASRYSNNNKRLQSIERKICGFYAEDSICNVMARFISIEDRLTYFKDKAGFIHLVSGINKKVIAALESEGITTIAQLLVLSEPDLLKIKGIGKVTAAKISNEINKLNQFYGN